jgi:hypothetical protein
VERRRCAGRAKANGATIRRLVVFLMATSVLALVDAGGQQDEEDRSPADQRREASPIEIQPEPMEESSEIESGTRGLSEERTVPLERPAWILFFHEGLDRIEEEISATIDRGYLPVALEANPDGSLTSMYVLSPPDAPLRWTLESYSAERDINSIVSTRILDGWNPLAFSVLEDTLVFLFGRTETSITDWRIHRSDLSGEAIASTLQQYQDSGYAFVDFGIDDVDDQVWYLFVKQEGRFGGPGTGFFVNAYPNGESVPAGMQEDYDRGVGIPFAFASGTAISMVVFSGSAPSTETDE